MRKLLSANFSRLWKDKVFLIVTALMLLSSAITMLIGCTQITDIKQSGLSVELDDFYFDLAPALGLFNAIFIALFVGSEYSDGTVRNKLVVGHSRTNIYLANFIVCFSAGLFFLAAWLIGGFVGIPSLGTWKIGIQGFAIFLLIAVFFTAAFTGIFLLSSTLSTNKAIIAVTAILLYLGLLLVQGNGRSLCR